MSSDIESVDITEVISLAEYYLPSNNSSASGRLSSLGRVALGKAASEVD